VPLCGGQHAQRFLLEDLGQRLDDAGFVVHDQDGGQGLAPRPRPPAPSSPDAILTHVVNFQLRLDYFNLGARAGVDAITRSELLKAVQVRVASVVTDVESADPARRSITDETYEAVDGVLAHAGPMPHGWARVRRGNDTVIRIWARLEVPRATLETAVRSLLERRGKTASASLLDGLTLPDSNTNP
jgi:hypothetical protein